MFLPGTTSFVIYTTVFHAGSARTTLNVLSVLVTSARRTMHARTRTNLRTFNVIYRINIGRPRKEDIHTSRWCLFFQVAGKVGRLHGRRFCLKFGRSFNAPAFSGIVSSRGIFARSIWDNGFFFEINNDISFRVLLTAPVTVRRPILLADSIWNFKHIFPTYRIFPRL